jgi:dTDP-4-dehydrorhamnose reductase
MRLVVTGGSGMLGCAVTHQAAAGGHDVTSLARADLDVTDAGAVDEVFGRHRPDAVVNCAAYTDVDGAETDERTAHAVNATGAGNVARAAVAIGARVLHVSTDYVFDGSGTRPYVESDPPAPRSAYGRTKLAGEREVLGAGPRHLVVRTSWLFGAGGRNFVDTMLALAAERDCVEVVSDQIGCPTWTGHLSRALVELAGRGDFGGIHHVAGAGSCSWHDLAVEAFALAAVACRVVAIDSSRIQRPAPRPAYSVLGSERRDAVSLPPWQEGVAAYLAQRKAAGEPAEPARASS